MNKQVEASQPTVPTEPIVIADEIDNVTSIILSRYSQYVSAEDVKQELYLYVLGDGKQQLLKWRAAGEAKRIRLALIGVGKWFAETEKAAVTGYHISDVAWYAPKLLEELIPLATDPLFDGIFSESVNDGQPSARKDPAQTGTLLAMVMDVRRAIGATDSLDPTLLADWLGGDFPESPAAGRGRTTQSNAAAQTALTKEYAG